LNSAGFDKFESLLHAAGFLRLQLINIAERRLDLGASQRSFLTYRLIIPPLKGTLQCSAGSADALRLDQAQDLIFAFGAQNDLFPQDFFYRRALDIITGLVKNLLAAARPGVGPFNDGIGARSAISYDGSPELQVSFSRSDMFKGYFFIRRSVNRIASIENIPLDNGTIA
jgi:hypothetical protein